MYVNYLINDNGKPLYIYIRVTPGVKRNIIKQQLKICLLLH